MTPHFPLPVRLGGAYRPQHVLRLLQRVQDPVQCHIQIRSPRKQTVVQWERRDVTDRKKVNLVNLDPHICIGESHQCSRILFTPILFQFAIRSCHTVFKMTLRCRTIYRNGCLASLSRSLLPFVLPLSRTGRALTARKERVSDTRCLRMHLHHSIITGPNGNQTAVTVKRD
jgi:hypothetical protein